MCGTTEAVVAREQRVVDRDGLGVGHVETRAEQLPERERVRQRLLVDDRRRGAVLTTTAPGFICANAAASRGDACRRQVHVDAHEITIAASSSSSDVRRAERPAVLDRARLESW